MPPPPATRSLLQRASLLSPVDGCYRLFRNIAAPCISFYVTAVKYVAAIMQYLVHELLVSAGFLRRDRVEPPISPRPLQTAIKEDDEMNADVNDTNDTNDDTADNHSELLTDDESTPTTSPAPSPPRRSKRCRSQTLLYMAIEQIRTRRLSRLKKRE